MTRRELLTRMSGPELSLQMAYDRLLDEESAGPEPDMAAKMAAFAAAHQARPGEVTRVPR